MIIACRHSGRDRLVTGTVLVHQSCLAFVPRLTSVYIACCTVNYENGPVLRCESTCDSATVLLST
jgi:hypothetical protein